MEEYIRTLPRILHTPTGRMPSSVFLFGPILFFRRLPVRHLWSGGGLVKFGFHTHRKLRSSFYAGCCHQKQKQRMLAQLQNKTPMEERRTRSESPCLQAAAGGGGGVSQIQERRARSKSPSSRLLPPQSGGRICRSASPSARLGGPRGRSGSPGSRLRTGARDDLVSLRQTPNDFTAVTRKLPGRSRSLSPSAKLQQQRGRSTSPPSRWRAKSKSASPEMNGQYKASSAKENPLLPPPPTSGWTFRKICGYLVPITLLLLSSLGLVIATGNVARFTPNFLEDLIPTLKNNEVVDPYTAKEGETTYAKWDNGGDGKGGLKLEVLNAMSDSWQVWFSLAVADWEYGNPDALTLPITKVAEEKDCKEVVGKLKVCNGDYGETKWRGINAATRDGAGFIIASTARMNEFYLNFDAEGAKQYTLCHEMGHGFGLTHTDENFDNPDLGNCLDYTNNFNDNKHPDVGLYESLLGLYGPASSSAAGESGSQRRRRRRFLRAPSSPKRIGERRALSRSFWDNVHDAVEKLTRRLDDSTSAQEDGWKLLHRSRHGEEHELELEGGYNVRVHFLLA